MNGGVTKLWSHDHIYDVVMVVDVMDINYDVIIFISKNLYFKKT